MATTTIEVSADLRDRIAAEARAQGTTLAAFLDGLLEDWSYRRRMAAVGAAFAHGLDDEYRADLAAWDAIGAGLPDG